MFPISPELSSQRKKSKQICRDSSGDTDFDSDLSDLSECETGMKKTVGRTNLPDKKSKNYSKSEEGNVKDVVGAHCAARKSEEREAQKRKLTFLDSSDSCSSANESTKSRGRESRSRRRAKSYQPKSCGKKKARRDSKASSRRRGCSTSSESYTSRSKSRPRSKSPGVKKSQTKGDCTPRGRSKSPRKRVQSKGSKSPRENSTNLQGKQDSCCKKTWEKRGKSPQRGSASGNRTCSNPSDPAQEGRKSEKSLLERLFGFLGIWRDQLRRNPPKHAEKNCGCRSRSESYWGAKSPPSSVNQKGLSSMKGRGGGEECQRVNSGKCTCPFCPYKLGKPLCVDSVLVSREFGDVIAERIQETVVSELQDKLEELERHIVEDERRHWANYISPDECPKCCSTQACSLHCRSVR